MIRYSVITEKNPREIVLLRGSGCKWRRCRFCDYHFDFSRDEEANARLNREVLRHVNGAYGKLEVINSGSFTDLDEETMERIGEVAREKGICELHFESHYMDRDQVPALRERFRPIADVKVKVGVETFDKTFREEVLVKGIEDEDPEVIAEAFDEVCLLQGLTGQTEESMIRDIETGLQYFERVCVNIMCPNSAPVQPDPEVIRVFRDRVLPRYASDSRVDILLQNTDFGVGGEDDDE